MVASSHHVLEGSGASYFSYQLNMINYNDLLVEKNDNKERSMKSD
jgi:hypothetical protein